LLCRVLNFPPVLRNILKQRAPHNRWLHHSTILLLLVGETIPHQSRTLLSLWAWKTPLDGGCHFPTRDPAWGNHHLIVRLSAKADHLRLFESW
jgi:hypothetical protein